MKMIKVAMWFIYIVWIIVTIGIAILTQEDAFLILGFICWVVGQISLMAIYCNEDEQLKELRKWDSQQYSI